MQLEVTTAAGVVRGSEAGGVASFKGIPYAAAPYGPLRFQAPAPVPPWIGVLDCLEFGPTPPKPPYPAPIDALLPDPSVPGEDILNLNVWTPDPQAGGLPVLVWIHGGAFVNGSSTVPAYDGSAFARDGVVLVSINYRLGIDGFLYFGDGGPENRGLLDQVAALRWVQDNIAAFGGDPARVTIGGESAGAMSVTSLLSMPLAAGLFRRAVAQSGSGSFALTPATADLVRGHVGTQLGTAPTRAALAALPVEQLVAAQRAVTLAAQGSRDPAAWGEVLLNAMCFEPTIDGTVLPVLPAAGVADGAGADVDLMVGTNTDEHRLFLVPSGVIDYVTPDLLALLAGAYRLPPAGLDLYRQAEPGATPGDLLSAVATDWFFRIPALRLAEARAGYGRPTYVYEFAWRTSAYDGRLRSCHALEIAFVFDTLGSTGQEPLQGGAPPQGLADAMHAAWVAFASTGDPGWPAYDVTRRPVQVFGDRVEVVEDPRGAQRALWEGVR